MAKRSLRKQSDRDVVIICGAIKRDKTSCQRPAGWGTSHTGVGRCRTHAGNVPNHRKNAVVKEAVVFMGAPKNINPLDAIMWCIRITAGEVEWLSNELAKVTDEEWIEHTYIGKQMNVLQRARAEAQDRLVHYSKEAIQLGLAERAIRLAENFGQVLAHLLERIAADLELTRAQREKWPGIIRRNLIMLEGGTPPDVVEGEVIAEQDAA